MFKICIGVSDFKVRQIFFFFLGENHFVKFKWVFSYLTQPKQIPQNITESLIAGPLIDFWRLQTAIK